MNKYRIYLNINNITDVIDIDATYPIIAGSVILFYNDEAELVCSIPNHTIFIKL